LLNFSYRPKICFVDRKKLSQFGHNVRKYKAMHIVMVYFSNAMG